MRHNRAPLRVLRLCSVFEPPAAALAARFDPIGGMQSHAGQLTRLLDRNGVTQTVVTTRPPGAARSERFGERARVVRLGLPVPAFRQLYSVQAALAVPRLAATADLVHVHLGEDLAALPIARAAARLHGLPLVLTVHTSLAHTLRAVDLRAAVLKTLGGAIERRGARAADAVLVLTPRLARELPLAGVDPDRVHVVPSGVDPALFGAPHADPFPGLPRPRIAFVGRLAPQKSVPTLVAATSLLARRDAHVVLVGDGPDRPAVEREIAARGLGDRVRVIGFVPHARVPAVLQHADLLVLPSVYEELGSVLLEAMQAGLPVVATRTGGIPDVVTDGVTGLLVPPSDPAALGRAIDRVLGSPELARRLADAGRERAKGYDWNALAGRVLDVYRAVLARRAAGYRRLSADRMPTT